MFVPLSTGEEQFLRQEDAQRRRKQRLIEVRLQEKRIAQERAQWYKTQIKETLDRKRAARLHEAEAEKTVALSSLHAKYTASMNAIGDAHALAAEFNSNLQMRAKRQLEALAYNDGVEDQRFLSAVGDAHEEVRRRGARERIARENMAKIQEIASRQRAHAEQVHRRKVERDERERKERDAMASAVEARLEHTIVPAARPHAVHLHESLLRHSRLHALTHTTKSSMKTSRILRHNIEHAAAMDAWNEGQRKSREVDEAAHARFLASEAQAADAHDRGVTAERRVADGAEAKVALRWLEDADRMFAQQTIDRQRDLLYAMNRSAQERGSHERATESAFEAMFHPAVDRARDERPQPQVHRLTGKDDGAIDHDEEAPRPLPPVTPVAAPAGVSAARNPPARHERPPPRRRPPPTVPSALYYPRMDSPTERPAARWPVMAVSASSSGGDVHEVDHLGVAAGNQTDAPPQARVDNTSAASSVASSRIDEAKQPTAKESDQQTYDDGQWAASPRGSVWSSPRSSSHSIQTALLPAKDEEKEMTSPRPQSPALAVDHQSTATPPDSQVVKALSTTTQVGEAVPTTITIEVPPPLAPDLNLPTPLPPPSQRASHQQSWRGVSSSSSSSSALSSRRSRTTSSHKSASTDDSNGAVDAVDATLSTPFVTTTSMDASVDPSTLDSIDGPAPLKSAPTTEQSISPDREDISASTHDQSSPDTPGPPLARMSLSSSDSSLLAQSRQGHAPRRRSPPPSLSSSSGPSVAPDATNQRPPTAPSSVDEAEAGHPESDWKSESFHITFDSAAISLDRPHPALRDEFYGIDGPASPRRASSLMRHGGMLSPASDRQDGGSDALLPCFDLNSSAFSSEDHWAPSPRPPPVSHLDGASALESSGPSTLRPTLQRFRLSSSGSSSSSSSSSSYAPSKRLDAAATSPRTAHQRHRQRLLDLVGSSSSSSSSSSAAPDDKDDLDVQMQSTLRRIQERVRDMAAAGELPFGQDTTRHDETADDDMAPPSPPRQSLLRGTPSWDAGSDGDLPPLDNVDLSMDLSSIGSSSPLSASWKRRLLGQGDTAVDAPLVLQWVEYAPRGSPTPPATHVHRLGGQASDDEDDVVLSTHSLDSSTASIYLPRQNTDRRGLDSDHAERTSSHGEASGESTPPDVEVEGKRSAPKSPRSASTGSSVEDLARAIVFDRDGGSGMHSRPTAAPASSFSNAARTMKVDHGHLSPSGSSSSSSLGASLLQHAKAAKRSQSHPSPVVSPTGGDTTLNLPTASPLSSPLTVQDDRTPPSLTSPRPAAEALSPTPQPHAITSPVHNTLNTIGADNPLQDGTRTSHSSDDDSYLTHQSIADPSDMPLGRQDHLPPPPASAHLPSHSSGTAPPSASPSSSATSGGRVNIAEEVVLVPHDAVAAASPRLHQSAAADRPVGGASPPKPHQTSHIVASEWQVAFASPLDHVDPSAASIGTTMDSIAAATSPPPPPSRTLHLSTASHSSAESSADGGIAAPRSSRSVVYPPHTAPDQLPPWASASRQLHAGPSIHPWPRHDDSGEDDEDIAQPMPATITLAGSVHLRPFAMSSDGDDDDDRASSASASSDGSLTRTRLSAAFPREHFPPMPHPRMDMSRPPPPAPSTLFDSDDQEDEKRLDQSRDSIAQHLRLRNPALYNRMVLRQQHVQSTSLPSSRRGQPVTSAPAESWNDDVDGPAARSSRFSQPTSATEHILMPPPTAPPALRQSAASTDREAISRAEMLARNQRLYAKLPEVVERKRQEEIARQRMDRLKKLREDDKARRQAKSNVRR